MFDLGHPLSQRVMLLNQKNYEFTSNDCTTEERVFNSPFITEILQMIIHFLQETKKIYMYVLINLEIFLVDIFLQMLVSK